jgi:hypothetical protein
VFPSSRFREKIISKNREEKCKKQFKILSGFYGPVHFTSADVDLTKAKNAKQRKIHKTMKKKKMKKSSELT